MSVTVLLPPDCPACYTLVLDSVSIHRERLAELERLLQDIIIHPTVLNDDIFEKTLTTVTSQVEELWNDAQEAARSGGEAMTGACISVTNVSNVIVRLHGCCMVCEN